MISPYAIAPMSDGPARLGVKVETEYGTPVTPSNSDAIRVLSPKFSMNADVQRFNESWSSRFTSQTFLFRRNATLEHNAYLYVPRTSDEVTAVVAYLSKLLLPSRMKNRGSGVIENGAVDDVVIADFVSDPDDIVVVNNVAKVNRTGCTLWFQEGNETRVITGARCDIGISASTTEPATLNVKWHGMTDGLLHPYVQGNPPQYPPLAKPNHLGAVMSLSESEFYIGVDTRTYQDRYHPMLKSVSIEFGNTTAILDDANSTDGISGIHIGGIADGAKVTFDIARPYKGSGTELDANTFPWMYWYNNSVQLAWGFSLLGSTNPRRGIRISGVMQLEEPPSESADGGIRRLTLTGTIKEHATLDPIRIAVIDNYEQ